MTKYFETTKKLWKVIRVYVISRCDLWLNSVTTCQAAIWDMA